MFRDVLVVNKIEQHDTNFGNWSYATLAPRYQDCLNFGENDTTIVRTTRGECSQTDLLNELHQFTTQAAGLARDAGDVDREALIIEFQENTHYIDSASFERATEGLANRWLEAGEGSEKILIYTGKDYKSELWVAGKVMEKIDDACSQSSDVASIKKKYYGNSGR